MRNGLRELFWVDHGQIVLQIYLPILSEVLNPLPVQNLLDSDQFFSKRINELSNIKILLKNKKAFFNYEILETLECGISLVGTEVKSLRSGKFSYGDAYVRMRNNELFLIGLHISPYDFGNINNHEALRERKLLANKLEIKKLRRKVDERGFSLVPIKIYSKNNLIKIEIGLGRGKKLHDKRNTIRDRDQKREAQRHSKQDY